MNQVLQNLEIGSILPRAVREDGQGHEIVIFDGNCRFCWGQVTRLKKLDIGDKLRFLSLHDPDVAERFPDLSREQLMAEMFVVSRDGKRRGGVNAIKYLSRRLFLLWPLMPFLHIPGTAWILRAAYRWVARRRYRLGGATECSQACSVHWK